MREDWAEKLRQKLEGHRKSPPPGLWEGICEQMGLTPEPVRQLHTLRRWYWAAAAAVLALVGFFVVVSHQPASEKLIAETPTSEGQKSKGQVRDSGVAMNQATCPPDFAPDVSHQPEQALPSIEEELPIELESHEEETHEEETIQEEQQEAQDERLLLPERNFTSDILDNPSGKIKRLPLSSHPSNWSLGVNASGGLLAANTSQRMDRLYYYSAKYMGEEGYTGPNGDKCDNGHDGYQSYNGYSAAMVYTLTEYRSEHHLPIRFGVSLNYQLTPRIALHSGINYTYLYSEFSIPLYEQVNYDQKLHYLGIPLGVSWQLWKTTHFQFYVSGGAMLEKCVSAEAEGSSVHQKPWQWSVHAAAGAEYDLIPQLGFYLEPSLGYYFDDGTTLEHYYKKHPLTPTIEFGLRLHLNK